MSAPFNILKISMFSKNELIRDYFPKKKLKKSEFPFIADKLSSGIDNY